MPLSGKVRTWLWFEDQGLAAAEFCCAGLPDRRVDHVAYSCRSALSGAQLVVRTWRWTRRSRCPSWTEGRAETDRLWEVLIADGGAESQRGWLKGRFGLSWQIGPKRAIELLSGRLAGKVWPALRQMKKVDIGALKAAADGG